MFRKVRRAELSERQRRVLSDIRRLSRELLQLANAQSALKSSNVETTSPQDLRAVRALHRAEQAVRDAIDRGLHTGLRIEVISQQGIERVVSEMVILSELAHFSIDSLRAYLGELERDQSRPSVAMRH
jgi:hypothetical protein